MSLPSKLCPGVRLNNRINRRRQNHSGGGASLGPGLAPPENALTQRIRITLAIPHKFNNEPGDHGHNRIVAIDQLQIVEKLVERSRHGRNLFDVKYLSLFLVFSEQPQESLAWHVRPRVAVTPGVSFPGLRAASASGVVWQLGISLGRPVTMQGL
jgi:hypothetical protein